MATNISTTVILPRHIDASFDAFDLDQAGKLYLGDAVLALDSLLAACWGKDATSDHHHHNKAAVSSSLSSAPQSTSGVPTVAQPSGVPPTTSGSKKDSTKSKNDSLMAAAAQQQQQQHQQQQQQQVAAQSGSGVSAESLTLPGVSRSKILQALKHAMHKAGVSPEAAAVSDGGGLPIVTKSIFDHAAQLLLAPLPNVNDVDSFAAFQSVNQSAEMTRVNRKALRRALFAEFDSDIYVAANDEDKFEARMRSSSASMISAALLSNEVTSPSSLSSSSSASSSRVGKFDAARNLVGCDELLLSRFAQYSAQGLSFDEWRKVVAPAPAVKKRAGSSGKRVAPASHAVEVVKGDQ